MLEIYQVIGEILYGVAKYDKLFQNHPDIREILETYFHNVLGFHYAVLKVFARSGNSSFPPWPSRHCESQLEDL